VEDGLMRNFMTGLVLGVLLTYCYLSNAALHEAAAQWWSWASSPPHRVADRRAP
jgi:hypothetical protein